MKNPEDFFRVNTGTSGFCTETPLWVAVNSKTGAPAWSNEIWLGLLTLEAWARFTPPTHKACISGTYIRSDEPA